MMKTELFVIFASALFVNVSDGASLIPAQAQILVPMTANVSELSELKWPKSSQGVVEVPYEFKPGNNLSE